jgi:hypothetical protein
MPIFKRTFSKSEPDGTRKTVEMSWDSTKPTETFKLEAGGYSGTNCLTELKSIETLIGTHLVTEKPEMYGGEDPQNVFLVGYE